VRKGPKKSDRFPRKVVALGGGTGMPSVLAGLRDRISNGSGVELTAVVTMSDDGGSSGRLRRSRGLPPPGDVRNCLLALSSERDLMTALFQHRYDGAEELGGHSLGNLILAALAEQTGSFLKAIEVSSRVLRTVGRILPATLDDVVLEARLADGSTLVGESAIGECRRRIESVALCPRNAEPTPGVVKAILEADLVVLGPGSLFTSLIPNLILPKIDDALLRTSAVRVLVGNLVSEKGEGAGLQHSDQLEIIERHVGGRMIDGLLVHDGTVSAELERRYREEGAMLLEPPGAEISGVSTFCGNLISDGPKLRHEPARTSAGIIDAWRALRAPGRRSSTGEAAPSVQAS
jgi:uncharacterized cofD-like protein